MGPWPRAAAISIAAVGWGILGLLSAQTAHANLLAPTSLGIDVGNFKSVVCVAKGHGVEVLVNEMSRRETATAILFKDRRRLFGDLAVAGASQAPESSITQLKTLIGREGDHDSFHSESSSRGVPDPEEPFGERIVGNGGGGEGGKGMSLCVRHLDHKVDMTAFQALAMFLGHLQREAVKQHGDNMLNTVLTVPSWMTKTQRRRVLDAAKIARLPSPQVVTEGTALSLCYGLLNLKRDAGPRVLAFVDIGHSGTQVTVANVTGSGVRVLAHEWDRSVGCKDLDLALCRMLATEVGGSITKRDNSAAARRARARLLSACGRLRTTLSANRDAIVTLDCMGDDGADVDVRISRESAEGAWASTAQRLKAVCKRAVEEAEAVCNREEHDGDEGGERVCVECDVVEVVGGGSYVPCLFQAVQDAFPGVAIQRTLNAAESVAKGAALVAAAHSAAFRISRPFKVADALPRGLVWHVTDKRKGSRPWLRSKHSPPAWVLPKGHPLPAQKTLEVEDDQEKVTVEVEEDGVVITRAKDVRPSAHTPTDSRHTPDESGAHKGVEMCVDEFGEVGLGGITDAAKVQHIGCMSSEDLEAAEALEERLVRADEEVQCALEARNELEALMYELGGDERQALEEWLDGEGANAPREEYEEKTRDVRGLLEARKMSSTNHSRRSRLAAAKAEARRRVEAGDLQGAIRVLDEAEQEEGEGGDVSTESTGGVGSDDEEGEGQRRGAEEEEEIVFTIGESQRR